MSVVLWVLSRKGLCDELITRLGESYRLWCVIVCDLETVYEEALAHWGLSRQKQTNTTCSYKISNYHIIRDKMFRVYVVSQLYIADPQPVS